MAKAKAEVEAEVEVDIVCVCRDTAADGGPKRAAGPQEGVTKMDKLPLKAGR